MHGGGNDEQESWIRLEYSMKKVERQPLHPFHSHALAVIAEALARFPFLFVFFQQGNE
jgi:hypothetical protein